MSDLSSLIDGAKAFWQDRKNRPDWHRKRLQNAEVILVVDEAGHSPIIVPLAWAYDAQSSGWEDRSRSTNTGKVQKYVQSLGLEPLSKSSEEQEKWWRASVELLKRMKPESNFSLRSENGEKRARQITDNIYYCTSVVQCDPTEANENDLEALKSLSADVQAAFADESDIRQARLKDSPTIPKKVIIKSTAFVRNPDVIAERLHLARGTCENCRKPAPFKRKSDGTPFLEVHHLKPLAEGGEDTVGNTQALCPNCHRKAHFG